MRAAAQAPEHDRDTRRPYGVRASGGEQSGEACVRARRGPARSWTPRSVRVAPAAEPGLPCFPLMPGVACASHRGRFLSVVLAMTTGPAAALPGGPQEESLARPGPAVRGCRDHTRTSVPALRRRWPGRSTGHGSTAGRRTASSIRQSKRCRRLSSQARADLRGRTRLSRGSPGAVRRLPSALPHLADHRPFAEGATFSLFFASENRRVGSARMSRPASLL